MSYLSLILLFAAAAVAGALNSVAGGGSFISFPTLLFTGVPPIPANATNTIALWPGTVASAIAYRDDLTARGRTLLILGSASVAGGLIGATLLLRTPEAAFVRLLPFLMLVATLLFTFSANITAWLRRRSRWGVGPKWMPMVAVWLLQLVIATYGGFFGGGIGILMLATLSMMGMEDINAMNALKTVLASLINGVAVVAFVLAGAIYWPQAIVMIVGAIVGGYGGANTARRIDPRLVRRFVITIGFGLTVYFFIR
jgi:uncharacterized membrane protein YfcA